MPFSFFSRNILTRWNDGNWIFFRERLYLLGLWIETRPWSFRASVDLASGYF